MYLITEESFLKDVEKHEMIIINEVNDFRHLMFKESNTNINHFNIITHKGYLHYCGDMGSYSFHRDNTDMIKFFNTKPLNDKKLYINESYWAEKCISSDKYEGIREWNFDVFENDFLNDLKQNEFSDSDIQLVKDEILYHDNPHDIYDAIYGFNKHYPSLEISTDDFEFETNYTNRFLWCLYALNWACTKYTTHLNKI